MTIDNALDLAKFDAADPSVYTGANFGTIQAAVVAVNSGADATSRMISYHEFSPTIVTNTGDLTLQFGTGGVYTQS
jgi:hypothetical protein